MTMPEYMVGSKISGTVHVTQERSVTQKCASNRQSFKITSLDQHQHLSGFYVTTMYLFGIS